MNNYEILLLTDLKATTEIVEKFLKSVFPNTEIVLSQLERTDLAYEINKQKKGNYFVASLTIDPSTIYEFRRRAGLEALIWRTLDLNLDSEKGLNRVRRDKPEYLTRGRSFGDRSKRSFGDRPRRAFGDREHRPFERRDGESSDRPARPEGQRSFGPRTGSSDRPRSFGPRTGSSDKPRSFAPRTPRTEDKGEK